MTGDITSSSEELLCEIQTTDISGDEICKRGLSRALLPHRMGRAPGCPVQLRHRIPACSMAQAVHKSIWLAAVMKSTHRRPEGTFLLNDSEKWKPLINSNTLLGWGDGPIGKDPIGQTTQGPGFDP